MNGLYLFQNDFRLTNNPLLNRALKDSDGITFAAFSPQSVWGHWRKQFYNQTLENLDMNLKKYGHRLHVINKEDLSKETLRSYERLYTPFINLPYENELNESLKDFISIQSLQTDRLLKELLFDLPNVFTQFRKKVEVNFKPNLPMAPIAQEEWPKPTSSHFKVFSPCSSQTPHLNSAFPFSGGETEAKNRVKQYIWQDKSILTYKETRNGLLGLSYSTKFSPWLSLGCICPHEIYREVENFEGLEQANESTYWVKFELWWREYFRWIGDQHGRRLFLIKGIQNKELDCIEDSELFFKWKNAQTGQPFVDATITELNETGWMSNRGRQNVASYLVKDLKLPWTWGAEYFEQHLIDFDPWSNYGNWQYVAGVGNDPRPNRYFNLEKQAKVYDPHGDYQKTWN